MLGSDDFNDVIYAALSKCRAAIVIWTKAAVKSNFVRDEARFQRRRRGAAISRSALANRFSSFFL